MANGGHGRKRSLSDPVMARATAVELVANGFDAAKAMKKVRPHLSDASVNAHAYKLLHEPEVLREIEKIMAKTEKTAKQFIDETTEVWDMFLGELRAGKVPEKSLENAGLACHRTLSKLHMIDKSDAVKTPPTMTFGNIDETELANLTGGVTEKKNVQ